MRFIHELMVILVIILGIIFFDIILDNYFYNEKIKIEDNLTQIDLKLSKDEDANENADTLLKDWKEIEKKSSFFMEHDELEKISNRITLLKKSINIESYDDAKQHLEETRFLINHVYEKDKLNLKNIF